MFVKRKVFNEDFQRTEKGSMADRKRKLGPVWEVGREKMGEGDRGKMGRVTEGR